MEVQQRYELVLCQGKDAERLTFEEDLEQVVEEAIDRMIPVANCFMILSAKPGVDGWIYLQTRLSTRENARLDYIVEARCVKEEAPKHFGILLEKSADVKALFRQFLQGFPPDVSQWEDITVQVEQQIKA